MPKDVLLRSATFGKMPKDVPRSPATFGKMPKDNTLTCLEQVQELGYFIV